MIHVPIRCVQDLVRYCLSQVQESERQRQFEHKGESRKLGITGLIFIFFFWKNDFVLLLSYIEIFLLQPFCLLSMVCRFSSKFASASVLTCIRFHFQWLY